MDYGGYDSSFVNDPPELFKCIVCHLVLKDPVMFVECTHQVCSSCFEYMRQHSGGHNNVLCPHDRLEVDVRKVVHNKGLARAILDFKVKCDNSSLGCDWVGELRHLERHTLDNCRCDHQQGTSKQLKELLHRMQACEKNLLKKDVEIAELNQRLERKEADILKLKQRADSKDNEISSLIQRLDANDGEIASLTKKVDLLMNPVDSAPAPSRSDSASEEAKLYPDEKPITYSENSDELELLDRSQINRKMNVDTYVEGQYTVFTWTLPQYSMLRTNGGRIYSDKFYARPNGHCCILSLSWFGEKSGRLGVYIHTCRGFQVKDDGFEDVEHFAEDPFDMAVTLEATNMLNSQAPSHHVNKAEILQNHLKFHISPGADVSIGYGTDYFLNSPVFLNDELIMKCTLWEQQELGWVSDGHVQQIVIG